jgi:hypothetical protein
VLLTRSRLCPRASPGSSLHLHVLSTPPAFVLSQDQTLREELHEKLSLVCAARPCANARPVNDRRDPYTVVPTHDGVLLYLTLDRHPGAHEALPSAGRTWTHTTITK